MKVELQGRVASVGIDAEGKKWSQIEVPDPTGPLPVRLTIGWIGRLGASAKVTVEVEE